MKYLFGFLLVLSFSTVFSQENVVKVDTSFKIQSDTLVLNVHFKADDHWMVYDSIAGDGGPIPLTYDFSSQTNLTFLKVIKPELKKKFDDIFEVDIYYFEHEVTYTFLFKIDGNTTSYSLNGFLEYMSCNLETGICLRPTTFNIDYSK